jgi:2-keto-4-pentenoate hydratase/2-oxohepta-3-ene-1,7-dioic acid hydratase in catechol pathway
MKLATILDQGRPTVSIVDSHTGVFWPLADAVPGLPPRLATDMAAAIGHLGAGRGIAAPSGSGRPLDLGQLLPPIATPPSNVMCVGKNYHAHAHEFTRSGFDAGATVAEAVPEHPIVFTKPASAISGPFANIPLWPGIADAVDYEAELVVVIGKGGRFIPRREALQHVFGYTIMNDVTARDLQRIHKQWFLGKAIDGFAPTGPWIVTADEIDPARLRVMSRVNGELRQDANTADLIFDVPTLIETISRSITLQPGDMIATGTPEGVGIGFDPPRFLAEGDVIEVEIEGIGTIRNTARRTATDQDMRRATAAE